MVFVVELSRRAELDLDNIFHFVRAAESQAAERWFNEFVSCIQSLSEFPERGAITDYDSKLRYLLFGNKPHIYLILYRIDERSQRVAIRHIRHGARKPLGAEAK